MLRQLKSALKNLFFVIKKPKVTPMKSQSKKDTNGGGSGALPSGSSEGSETPALVALFALKHSGFALGA